MFKAELKRTMAFVERNIKVFFKDKGSVVSALISPLVILLLYVLFLHGVLKSSFTANVEGLNIPDKLINGFVASFEISSILAVCGVTVAFIANMSMADDRVSGVRADLDVTSAPQTTFTVGYYLSTFIITLGICYVTLAVGFVYVAICGWYLSVGDVFLLMLDVMLNAAFGTALSSIVCTFIKSKNAINAVSTIVSTVYGFICGAYYPISQFASGIANTVMCLPGTYITGLIRGHFMQAFGTEFVSAGLPQMAVDGILDSMDVNIYFFGTLVPTWTKYVVAVSTVVVLVAVFVVMNIVIKKLRVKN